MTTKTLKIGIIGVGLMGHGIALNILKAGYSLTMLDHAGNQPIEDLISLGASTKGSALEVARTADIIILCVTGTPQVEDVLYRQDGVLAGLQPGAVVIDCSTAIPSSTLKVAADVTGAGGRFLDAPMTRTPKEAAEGRLNLIVGGAPEDFQHCLPVFQSYAENIVHAGPVGSGHQLKLLHNFVSLGFSAVISEAAACAQQAGLAPQTLVDVLAAGGGKGVVLDRLTPYILHKDPSGFRFSLSNALKDMTYLASCAQSNGVANPMGAAVRNSFATAVGMGNAQRFVPMLSDIVAEQNGVKLTD